MLDVFAQVAHFILYWCISILFVSSIFSNLFVMEALAVSGCNFHVYMRHILLWHTLLLHSSFLHYLIFGVLWFLKEESCGVVHLLRNSEDDNESSSLAVLARSDLVVRRRR